MFGYPCPFCQQRLLAAPERAGQRTICPKCLKPIVIPKPDEEKKPAADPVPDAEADEVPITAMPPGLDDSSDAMAQTPLPDTRPPARVGAAVGTPADPIPLQHAPLQHAAAVLVRNPDSVADFDQPPAPAPRPPQAFVPTPAPVATPRPPAPASDPHFPTPAAFTHPTPLPDPPSFPAPTYPAPGRITGDHPAATMPGPSVGHNNSGGLVVFNPTDIDAADLAAELTTVLTMRMKPPPEPPSDLRLTTGVWIILTACGLALWLFCMMSDTEPLKYVAVIGAVELLLGYGWVAVTAGRRNPRQGLVTLLPPVWVYRAANPPYEPGYRPLRFVVAGAILLTLYVAGPKVQPTLFNWIGFTDPAAAALPPVVETPLMKLEEAERERNPISLQEQLTFLAQPESLLSAAAKPSDKAEVVMALRRLVKHPRGEVRADALRALAAWSPDDAKPLVLAAVASPNEDERAAAYDLVSRWADADTAKVLVARVAASDQAKAQALPALEVVGKTERGRQSIEEALLPLLRLNRPEDRNDLLALAAANGGRPALAVLEARPKASAGDNDPQGLTVARIKARLGVK